MFVFYIKIPKYLLDIFIFNSEMHHAPFYTNIIQHIFKNMYLKHVNMFKKIE